MGCEICPRRCGVLRDMEAGFCGAVGLPRVACAALHQWEEPCISGTRGSGAVFFSGCNMACVFCQNYMLQSGQLGSPRTARQLADEYLRLQSLGAHNINLVTPAPHVPYIIESLSIAKAAGLTVPVVYNTNAYETVDTLRRLDGLVDVYLPDLKYVSPVLSARFSKTPDYFAVAMPAISEMLCQTGHLSLDADGMAVRGVLIRYLVLPGCVFDAKAVMDAVKGSFSTETYLSIMRQYAPTERCQTPPLNRKVTAREYDQVLDYALSLGFSRIWMQKGASADLAYTPAFTDS